MGRKNKLDLSFAIVEDFFDKSDIKSFTENKFKDILNRHRYEWSIPDNKYSKQILAYLIGKQVLLENSFLTNANENKKVYSWKTKDEFTIISGLKSDSYFSHYSALFLHQLSLQIPKTIYLNFEHTSEMGALQEGNSLTQEAIDKAFAGSQRKSMTSLSFSDKKIILLNSKFTGRLGIEKRINNEQSFSCTDIERTLIDISVRPVYAGGVFEVLEAYKLSKGKLNVAKMADYLTKLNFIYPYHQVIGFYLEKAGYNETDMQHFKSEMEFNFYLTYDIRNKEFSPKWKLYYPKGI